MPPCRPQRRRHVPDRHRPEPPLGRRRLTRVVDDERIDDRQPAGQQRRKAGRRQRHRLTGQPLQRPMRSDVQQRVDARHMPQPEIERDEPMPRRAIGIMIPGLAIERRPAIRLHREHRRADPHVPVRERIPHERRVSVGRPPRRQDGLARHRGEGAEQPVIRREVDRRPRWCVTQPVHQRLDRRCRPQPAQDGVQARERIEPDRVPDPSTARIIRQHAAQRRRLRPRQPRPAERPIRRQRDPVRIRRMHRPRELETRHRHHLLLERDRSRQQPPVQLRQRDVHRQVRPRQPTRRRRPPLSRRPGQHHLQHRRPARLQRRRERRRVQHHVRPPIPQDLRHERRADRLLQARHKERPHL